jgi:guanylate kinase
MANNGLLIVISGPSGTGKGTICRALCEDKDLWISVSATTREPRAGENEGVNYFFLSRQEFLDKIENDDFFEYAEVYGNYYGTPKWKALEAIYSGKDVLLEIDIQGALKVKQQYPEGVFIFLLPPSMEELKKRIENRGTETLMRRFKSAYHEMNYVSKYNYAVVNDTVENAVDKIKAILTAEKCRVDRFKDKILDSEEVEIHE